MKTEAEIAAEAAKAAEEKADSEAEKKEAEAKAEAEKKAKEEAEKNEKSKPNVIKIQLDDASGILAKDLQVMKDLAIKGLLSDFKEEKRAKLAELVKGKSLTDASNIIEAFKDLIAADKPKIDPVTGKPVIPVTSTGAPKISRYSPNYEHKFK